MLNYLVTSTEQLITAMVILGTLFGYVACAYAGTERRRFSYITIICGLIMSVLMTYFKVWTNKVDTGIWNLRIYAVTLVAFVVFLLTTALRKKLPAKATVIPLAALSVYSMMIMLYFFPFYMELINNIMLSESTLLSTAAIYKLIGWIAGLILTFVAALAVSRSVAIVSEGKALAIFAVIALINTAKQVAASFSIMLARRIIPSNHTLFVIAKYASNYSLVFIVLTLVAAFVSVAIIWVASFLQHEPYSNPAQHRKIKAKWLRRRRWCITTAFCFALSMVILTAVNAYANQEVELSPIEDAVTEDGYVWVPFDQVSDGHLHRFGYTTDNNITVRFIVIKKPNSSAYGIGLDACDICGETGYYEKDDQVVCNLCDVVMNINTIGFKGGCNPIVIDYSIENGFIKVPIEGLIEFESEFK